MWLECCQTERGQQWYDDVLCGGARVEQEAVPGTHMTVPARVAVCRLSAVLGAQGVGRDSRRPHGPWGCRAGPEGKWENPMAASQAASCPPRFKRTERKESPWQAQCRLPLQRLRLRTAAPLQRLRIAGPLQRLRTAGPLRQAQAASRPLPILQPAKLVPSRHSNPPASCASWRACGGGWMSRLASYWWGGEQQCR